MAVTLTVRQLGPAIGVDASTATRLRAVVVALVGHYAPSAPEAVANEAAIRAAGWLAEQPNASIRSEREGEIQTDYAPSQTGAMLHSGAKSLLYPWRAKTAGIARCADA